ncbi:AAA family ATPase [Rhodoferax sp.]|jgi:HTH-type transcriptional repressor of NAD biosynthesis genes|uniref:AAA family ATPase n=1 Tax=Rhodoferax sp. TaxID=50421 RepID=UPI003783A371
MRVAILGAECTGKTHLASALAQQLQARIPGATWVGEYLREWCDRQGRTPHVHEQRGIAQEQIQRVLAQPNASLLISDTAPLLTAVYSEVLFGDTSLYGYAIAQHRQFQLTLVTGLDLPWVADSFQRDGPALRAQVDRRLRAVLLHERIDFSTVYGHGGGRTQNALLAVEHALRSTHAATTPSRDASWAWLCESCSDADCEHRLFRAILAR